jgi:septum formation protein
MVLSIGREPRNWDRLDKHCHRNLPHARKIRGHACAAGRPLKHASMSPSPLILGSTSRYRRQLLERLGLPFEVKAPTCDEEALKDPTLSPQALAEFLAAAKAASIAIGLPQAVVIGSDQVAAFEDTDGWHIIGKPGTVDKAVSQLSRLSGRSHVLITAIVVQQGTRIERHTDITTLTMRTLTIAQLHRYVVADLPLDCAGAYKLEARGISLFSSIKSADHSAIIGLPLIELTRILTTFGYVIP